MKNKSHSNRFNRNAAFSMNLSNPDLSEADAIYCQIVLNGHLVIFLENSIAEILLAENIDPDNKEPNTRHSYQLKYSIGSRNPIVARTILQAKNILDGVVLNKGLNKQTILDHVWDCTQHLIACENSFYEIYSDTMRLMSECDDIIKKTKAASHVPSLPQVENLEQRVVTFLSNGKRFLEKTHRLLCIFYGVQSSDSNFQAYRDWMVKHESSKTDIIALLESDKDWIKMLAWYRNALNVNHSRPGFKVHIENFKLCAGNRFTNPCWQYDFSDKENKRVQDEPNDLINDMNVYLMNMLGFFEELFLLCVKDNWDVRYPLQVYCHPDDDINPKCPKRYFVSQKQEN